jgi:hypothetical protein
MNNEKEITAVDWFAIEEDKLFTQYQNGFFNIEKYILYKHKLRRHCRLMEKEQLRNTFYKDRLTADVEIGLPINWEFEQFYKETYENEQQ